MDGRIKLNAQAVMSLWQSYDEVLQMLESGLPENTTVFLRELRFKSDKDILSETLRRLISIRIALKCSTISDDGVYLIGEDGGVLWIQGEIHLVVGLAKYHQGLFLEGSAYFKKAEKIFADVDFAARSLLSAFNSLIGEFYAGTISDSNVKLEHLRILEKRCRSLLEKPRWDEARVRKVFAMILREKAVLFEKENRLYAAIEELEKAIDMFSLEGTRSDYHLALIQGADLKLLIGDRQGALSNYEHLIPPVDTRVEFPLAYLKWRLFAQEFDLSAFTVLPPTWVERFKNHQQKKCLPAEEKKERYLKWNIKSNQLHENSVQQFWKLKATSLEGKLLRLLIKMRASKTLLTETLWPEYAQINELDHRLHQLISRMNQKFGGIIIYDGSAYRLSCVLDIE
ncbi:MAG: hypothetical protein ACXVCY_17000 [Pseudobdellovibrionaceae bacterium]